MRLHGLVQDTSIHILRWESQKCSESCAAWPVATSWIGPGIWFVCWYSARPHLPVIIFTISRFAVNGDFPIFQCRKPQPLLTSFLVFSLPMAVGGTWPLFHFLNVMCTPSVEFLKHGISPSQGLQTGKHRHPCLEWDSNPWPHCLSRRRQFIILLSYCKFLTATEQTHTNILASSGIRTHDPIDRGGGLHTARPLWSTCP
jgi:hypothetical protein